MELTLLDTPHAVFVQQLLHDQVFGYAITLIFKSFSFFLAAFLSLSLSPLPSPSLSPSHPSLLFLPSVCSDTNCYVFPNNDAGARVCLCDVSDSVEVVRKDIEASGGQTRADIVDVSKESEVGYDH
tara:strand:+ start:20 stop:397 length:378 start_codon:yes stop_codon:yes gene_type:complete